MIKRVLKRPSTYFFICILITAVICTYKFELFSMISYLHMKNYLVAMFPLFFDNYVPVLLSLIIAIIANLNIHTDKKIKWLVIIINSLLAVYVTLFLLIVLFLKN
jgi:hypothetical protein